MTNASTSHLMSTYANLPISLDRGEGVWLWDEDGRKYLDGLAGIAVNTLGHNHKRLVAALTDQVTRIIHSSNIYRVRNQELLSAQLAELSHMDKVFFCNSGLEANEAAIKIARKFGHDKGIELPGDRGLRQRLSRQIAGHAVGHRQRQGTKGFRSAGRRLRSGADERSASA